MIPRNESICIADLLLLNWQMFCRVHANVFAGIDALQPYCPHAHAPSCLLSYISDAAFVRNLKCHSTSAGRCSQEAAADQLKAIIDIGRLTDDSKLADDMLNP